MPGTARHAVLTVLEDRTYRVADEQMRVEIDALPGPGRVVALLQRLDVERQPIVGVG